MTALTPAGVAALVKRLEIQADHDYGLKTMSPERTALLSEAADALRAFCVPEATPLRDAARSEQKK